MADVVGGVRLRFVGRPGRRFDPVPADPSAPHPLRTDPDPITRLLANVHTDLRLFSQIVGGESDTEVSIKTARILRLIILK